MFRRSWFLVVLIIGLQLTTTAAAGMPAPIGDDVVDDLTATGLQESALARLQNISFFLMGFLVSALLIKFIWNSLGKDWTFLPRLTYRQAVGVVFLWGVVFLLVLTMISGARELMTPGAWEKQGVTYRLPDATPTPAAPSLDEQRKQQMARLRAALWDYADNHNDRFPDDLAGAGVTAEQNRIPDPSHMPYQYVHGQRRGAGPTPLVYEPDIFGTKRFVLYTNGDIGLVSTGKLQQTLAARKP